MTASHRAGVVDTYDDAVAYLDQRIGRGVKPGLERIAGVLELMGRPDGEYRIVHVAGTNGKTTTTRMVRDLLGAHGLTVGTFTSPHLHSINERFTVGGAVLDDDAFIRGVADVVPFVDIFEADRGESLTYFEVTTAMALALFAANAVDVAVVEVGLGGRLDATNAITADVSAITGVAIDHTGWLGDTIAEIAAEKAAILKQGGLLVSGPLPEAAEEQVVARVEETGSRWLKRGRDFDVEERTRAVGGWLAQIEGVYGDYRDVLMPLHGSHQVDHLATAIASVEALLGRDLDGSAVLDAAEAMTAPGRLEVVSRRPLVLIDGAHNEEGFEGLASAMNDEFPHLDWILVVGLRGERETTQLLTPLRGWIAAVVATAPDDPEAVSAEVVAAGASAALDVGVVEVVPTVDDAMARAEALAGPDGAIATAGSLYVAGEARWRYVDGLDPVPRVHGRIEPEMADVEDQFEGEDFEEPTGYE